MTSPLIPRELLFGNPDHASPLIDPTGTRVAWLAPLDGVLNIWVAPVGTLEQATPITSDTVRGIRNFIWMPNGEHLVYAQDEGGDEDWHLYSVPVNGGATKDLTPLKGIQARIIARSHRQASSLLVGINDRQPQLHDVYRVDVSTGERELVLENPGILSFIADLDFNLVVGYTMTPDGGAMMLRPTADGWAPSEMVPAEDSLTTAPISTDASGETLYMIDSRDRDTAAAIALSLTTGDKTVLGSDDRADIVDLMVHPESREIQAIASEYERKEWQILDASIQDDMDELSAIGGEVSVLSRDRADRTWTVALVQDAGPVQYGLWHRENRQFTPMFLNRSALATQPLNPMRPVVIPSRDGLDLVSYLTLPAGADTPHPLVLVVHGGPWARDSWGYNPVHQWLSNRGYAVLSVNFRGSTGFGKQFINAGNLEWAGKMHDDLLDAVSWAVDKGVCEPDQVAILGGSYGGYATLVGLTFTPDVFACGVDIVGPSNIVTLIESIPEYWKPMIAQFHQRVGDSTTESGMQLLIDRSPIHRVDQIKRPLLIGQGANDPRVKQAESDQIVHAMKRAEIPVTYVLFPDEGHGFARPENNIAFWAIAEAFLAEHLGGRCEPAGNTIAESTAQCLAGTLP